MRYWQAIKESPYSFDMISMKEYGDIELTPSLDGRDEDLPMRGVIAGVLDIYIWKGNIVFEEMHDDYYKSVFSPSEAVKMLEEAIAWIKEQEL